MQGFGLVGGSESTEIANLDTPGQNLLIFLSHVFFFFLDLKRFDSCELTGARETLEG